MDCVICFTSITAKTGNITLPCSHIFHIDCLLKCIKYKHKSCPCCRARLMPCLIASSETAAIKVQSFWRGYNTRNTLSKALSKYIPYIDRLHISGEVMTDTYLRIYRNVFKIQRLVRRSKLRANK